MHSAHLFRQVFGKLNVVVDKTLIWKILFGEFLETIRGTQIRALILISQTCLLQPIHEHFFIRETNEKYVCRDATFK